ncbi:hypothetical protein ASG75_11925 [Rhodanobacter sp. Soil772]|nr:hypothetical protein ASG75_11925 [Rhodanobacter sp. Soil772]
MGAEVNLDDSTILECAQMATKMTYVKTALLALALCSALALQGCSEESDTNSQASAPQAAAAEATSTNVSSSLRISGFGPTPVKAGEPFNVQPNQQAALWVRVDQPLDGTDAAVYLDGVKLQSYISGNLITAAVPASLYAKAGQYALHVAGSKGKQSYQSGDVQFIVQ